MATKKRPTYEEAKTELLALRQVYRRVFRTPDGEKVVADMKQRVEAGRGLRPAEGQPLDPYQAVWNEGARFPIRWITSMLEGEDDA